MYTSEAMHQLPFFIFKDGTPLTHVKFSNLVVDTVKAAGWQGNFTPLSFRVGAATWQLYWVFPTIMLGQWSGGIVMHTYYM